MAPSSSPLSENKGEAVTWMEIFSPPLSTGLISSPKTVRSSLSAFSAVSSISSGRKLEDGLPKVRVVNAGLCEIGAAQVGSLKMGRKDPGRPEVYSSQLDSIEVCGIQQGAPKAGTCESGATKVYADHFGLAEVCPGEVPSAEAEASQLHSPKITALPIGPSV